jgi:hypothetical protein
MLGFYVILLQFYCAFGIHGTLKGDSLPEPKGKGKIRKKVGEEKEIN